MSGKVKIKVLDTETAQEMNQIDWLHKVELQNHEIKQFIENTASSMVVSTPLENHHYNYCEKNTFEDFEGELIDEKKNIKYNLNQNDAISTIRERFLILKDTVEFEECNLMISLTKSKQSFFKENNINRLDFVECGLLLSNLNENDSLFSLTVESSNRKIFSQISLGLIIKKTENWKERILRKNEMENILIRIKIKENFDYEEEEPCFTIILNIKLI